MNRPVAPAPEAHAAVQPDAHILREPSSEGPRTHVVLNEQSGRRVPALLILAGLVLSCALSLHGIYGNVPKAEPGAVVSASKMLVSFVTKR